MRTSARTTDPETSHQAAASVHNISYVQRTVLSVLRVEPMTDEMLVHIVNYRTLMSPSGIRTRRAELVALGLVRDSGERAILKTGRKAIVWEAV